jgi:hypothetical protein
VPRGVPSEDLTEGAPSARPVILGASPTCH